MGEKMRGALFVRLNLESKLRIVLRRVKSKANAASFGAAREVDSGSAAKVD